MKYAAMILMTLFSTLSYGSDFEPDVHVFPVELDNIVDGDTMDVHVDLGRAHHPRHLPGRH